MNYFLKALIVADHRCLTSHPCLVERSRTSASSLQIVQPLTDRSTLLCYSVRRYFRSMKSNSSTALELKPLGFLSDYLDHRCAQPVERALLELVNAQKKA